MFDRIIIDLVNVGVQTFLLLTCASKASNRLAINEGKIDTIIETSSGLLFTDSRQVNHLSLVNKLATETKEKKWASKTGEREAA